MRSSRVFVVTAALALAAAMSALPVQTASAQPPSTQVVVPATGASVSSTQVVLDAFASPGVTQVQFELTGGTLSDSLIATATPTEYGWVALWNSTTVANGTYTLQSVATADGSSATSPGISITTWQCTTSAAQGDCPYPQDSEIEGNVDGQNPEVDQNVWSPINGWSQTLYANSPADWQVVASEPAGNTAVVTYPNTSAWVNVDNIPVDSYNTTVSSFNETMPHNAQTTAWAMYDLWFNNWNDEVMIQYDFTNNADCDSSTVVANNVTFGGSNGVPAQQWHLCDFGLPSAGSGGCPAGPNCTLDWKLGPTEGAGKQSESSGSIDIKAMIDWLEYTGYLPARSTWTALSDGWEICSTGGQNETFAMNDFSVSATPSTSVIIPSNNATVSGTQLLDATASAGVTSVQYEVTGGSLDDAVVATATATYYGWLAAWNTASVPDGTYTLQSVASYGGGVSGTSPPITVTVNN